MAETHRANRDTEIETSDSGVEYPHDVSLSESSGVVSDIGRKLESLGPPLSPECCIYRVPKKLRKVNKAAYTPQVVSIGPLHYGKKTLNKMEKHKLRYLGKFLALAEKSLEYFVCTIKASESIIRSCYAETFDHLSSDVFVEMILVDAGFIIWLFLRKKRTYLMDQNDKLLYKPWLSLDIMKDLILLENQLPFFVLQDLYDLAFPNDIASFLELTCHYFSMYNKQNKSIQQEVRHFTDLLRSFHLPHSGKPEIHEDPKQNDKSIQQRLKHFTGLLIYFLPHCGKTELHDAINVELKKNAKIDQLYSATELHDAGVKFEVSPSQCLFDIKLSNGVLTIPRLKLYDETEAYIRNLMALEQCQYPYETYICNYVTVMDNLINTTKDVDLLVQKKIIVNWLGDPRPVATLFNKLCTRIIMYNDSWYTSLCEDLTAYHEVRCHKWQAILKQDYFSTPWRGASTTAAIILLVLTFIQTICSIMSL